MDRVVRVHNSSNDDASSIADTEKVYPWQLDNAPVNPEGQGILEPIDDYINGIAPEFKPSTSRTTSRDFASHARSADAWVDPINTDIDPRTATTNAGLELSPSNTSTGPERDVFHALEQLPVSNDRFNETAEDVQDGLDREKQTLTNFLTGAHQKLLRNSNDHEKKAYANCRQATLPEATKYLLLITHDDDKGFVNGLSALDTFFVAAVQVFEFFLPLENESEIAKRYWGSVLFIMKVCVEVTYFHTS
jgi:hypothetical protein